MKILKSPQKVLILFLSVLIVLSFIMILRLEGKTAALQSKWDEHQLSLKANEDILNKLDYFSREVKNGLIKLDGNNASLESAKSHVTVFDKGIDLVSDGDVQLISKNACSISYGPKQVVFYSEKDGDMSIAGSVEKRLGYDKKNDYIYMFHTGSSITIGKHGNNQRKGIELISKTGGPNLVIYDDEITIDGRDNKEEYKISIAPQKNFIKIKKGESELVFEKDNISLAAAKDIYFQYDSKLDLISMVHKNAHISTGNFTIENQNHHGAIISSANRNNQLVVTEDQILLGSQTKSGLYRIGIAPAKEIIEISRGHSVFRLEKDEFKITTPGDINITSTNGNVNINGKKVSFNE